jgi:hypothetical protein
MKQWKVTVWPSGKSPIETVVTAKDYWDAKKIAAAMFQCQESDVKFVTEIK